MQRQNLQASDKTFTNANLLFRRTFGITTLEWLALFAIVIVAALLRLGWAGTNSFAYDESTLSLLALRMVRGGQFASLGMVSSAGVPNPPAAVWIMGLPYLFSTDPLVATQFIGVLSLGTVLGVWALARQLWGGVAAFSAAIFLATSPQAVVFARNIWSQDMLIPLSLLWAFTAYRAMMNEHARWAVSLNVFLAGFIFQVHPAGLALALGTALLLLYCRWWRGRLVAILIGAALALLSLVPYMITLVNQNLLQSYAQLVKGPTQIDLGAVEQFLHVVLGTDWGYMLLGDLDVYSHSLVLAVPVGLILIGGVVVLLRQITRKPDAADAETHSKRLAVLILTWAVVTPLLFLRHSTPVFPHYELVALPAAALIVGAATRLFANRRWAYSVASVMALISVAWTAQIGLSLDRAARVTTPNGLGVPISVVRNAAYAIPENTLVLYFMHGDNPAIDGEAAEFSVLWWNHPHRIINGENELILPSSPATIMATLAPFQAWEEFLAVGFGSDAQSFPRRRGELPFVAAAYDGHTAPSGFTVIEPPVVMGDGLQLEGWRVRHVGDRLRFDTLWRVLTLPTGVDLAAYHQFHHLRTADSLDGTPLLISDVPLAAYNWQVGDRVIVIRDFFPKTSGPFWVDVGHYTLPDGQRVLQPDGSDHVRFGPFNWPQP